MGKIKKGSWAEINKKKKEEKRKWKEENLQKKLEKQDTPEDLPQTTNPEPPSKSTQTVSIAIPGSILENAQTFELGTYLAGQIARAACMFQVDEIVVFDDYADEASAKKDTIEEDGGGVKTLRKSCAQMDTILRYLECPQYLRKKVFRESGYLKKCGLLPPLQAPHHFSKTDESPFREGVVVNKPVRPGKGSFVDVGLAKDVQIDKLIPADFRCTVKLSPEETKSHFKGVVVAPSTPKSELGIYWGYNVRTANSLAKIFSQTPYHEGYDLTIGTSDKGTSVDEFVCPEYKHLLIVFGGVEGLEFALENDDALDADDPKLIFDHYLNTLPEQGSKTLRTEEAVLVTLSVLRPKLNLCTKT